MVDFDGSVDAGVDITAAVDLPLKNYQMIMLLYLTLMIYYDYLQ